MENLANESSELRNFGVIERKASEKQEWEKKTYQDSSIEKQRRANWRLRKTSKKSDAYFLLEICIFCLLFVFITNDKLRLYICAWAR